MLVVQWCVAHVLGNECERQQRVRRGGVLAWVLASGLRGVGLAMASAGCWCCLHVDQGQVWAWCGVVAMYNEHRRLPRVEGGASPHELREVGEGEGIGEGIVWCKHPISEKKF